MNKEKLNNSDLDVIAGLLEQAGFEGMARKVRDSMDGFWARIIVKGHSFAILVDTEEQFDELITKLAAHYFKMFGVFPDWSWNNESEDVIDWLRDEARRLPDLDPGCGFEDSDNEELEDAEKENDS